jgi:proteasome lid subunit RPN8/RPN11
VAERPRAAARAAATVILPPAVRRAIVAHARATLPDECCGLLLGRGSRVDYALPVANVAASPTRFQLDPRAHIDVRRILRNLAPALEIVGVYHSHPHGDAQPSSTDVREAAYRNWLHVIVGLAGSRSSLGAFRIRSGRVARARLKLR